MSITDSVNERAQARVGSVLRGKWRLDRVLGVGGMATVYAATHRNQARVAIKVLHSAIALEADVTARFLREGYMANVVEHSGTAKVLDDDVSEDGAPFLVMELLEGETVDARWERKKRRLPYTEAIAIADQILDVLAVAHAKGVVHRDLKPENLFLTTSGELKILDFGIARLRELPSDPDTRTRAGSLLGTPAYMAPEQARGRWDLVDARTDLWAVGATLFTLLSGRFVHEARTVHEQLIATATVRARSIGSLVNGLPLSVIEIVDRALTFDKAERWPDARTMQMALRSAIRQGEQDAPLTLPVPSVVTPDAGVSTGPSSSGTSTGPSSSERGMTNRSYTTARPVTQGIPSGWVSTRRSSARYVVLGMAIVLGGAVGVWQSCLAVRPMAEPPALAARATSAPETAPIKPGAVDAEEPKLQVPATAAPTATVAPKSSASSKPALVARPKPEKPPEKPPSTSSPTEPRPNPTSNPFDRRF